MNQIECLIKKPGEQFTAATIRNDLKTLQAICGGYIQIEALDGETALICNEDRTELPYNCTISGTAYYGNLIVCGHRKTALTDIGTGYVTALRG